MLCHKKSQKRKEQRRMFYKLFGVGNAKQSTLFFCSDVSQREGKASLRNTGSFLHSLLSPLCMLNIEDNILTCA